MKDIELGTSGKQTIDALIAFRAGDTAEHRRMAWTSDAPALLAILSKQDDYEIVMGLLANENTPAEALTNLLDNKQFTSGYDERKRLMKLQDLVNHQNVDMELFKLLAAHPDWEVRYGLVLREKVPPTILRQLAADPNLAVAAAASRRLGLPAVDEALGVPVKCSEINAFFERVKQSIRANADDANTLVHRFDASIECKYSPIDSFFENCNKALAGLIGKLSEMYVALLQKDCVPNIRLDHEHFPQTMALFDREFFDAYIIAAQVKELVAKRETTSMAEILKKARDLLPYVKDEASSQVGGWGPATKPEQILDGQRLKLRVYLKEGVTNSVYVEEEKMESLASMDKLSKIIIRNADPATVQSVMRDRISYSNTPQSIYSNIAIDNEPVKTMRFFKNKRLDVEYASEAEALKVAKILVAQPPAENTPQKSVGAG
jgi:hypothetical protein